MMRMISFRQYTLAALAGAVSSALWWALTRRAPVAAMTLGFTLLLPLASPRDRERPGRRMLLAFLTGVVVAVGDWVARRNGWIR